MAKQKTANLTERSVTDPGALAAREVVIREKSSPPHPTGEWNCFEEHEGVFWRATGMFVEVRFPEVHNALAKALNVGRQMHEKACALGGLITTETAKSLRSIENFCRGLPSETSTDQWLAKVAMDIDDAVSRDMTADQQAALADVLQAGFSGYLKNLVRAWSLHKQLQSAFDAGDFGLAIQLSYLLGEDMAAYALRRNYEHVVVRSNKQLGPLKQKQHREQTEMEARKMAASLELLRRCLEDKNKSPTEHLEAMAKVKVLCKGREKAKWGNRRTLMSYHLIQKSGR